MNNIFFNLISNLGGGNLLSSIFSSKLLAQTVSLTTGKDNWILTICGKVFWFLTMVFYTIAKFILLCVDLIFTFIRKLCGLNIDTSSIEKIFSTDSDMVFNLLYSSQEVTIPIFKALIILAIVVIVIFTIIAIIKSQFEALQTGKAITAFESIKKSLRAFALLLITPLIAISGIAFSNILLKSLYNATNISGSASLGTQIFYASTSVANSYRNYAQSGKRIPILFDDRNSSEVLKYYSENTSTAPYVSYLKDSKNLVYATYMMFVNEDFQYYSNLNDVLQENNTGEVNIYYTSYDASFEDDTSGNDLDNTRFKQFKRISSYASEYYVMADVIDYAVSSTETIYFKTIEDVFDSILKIQDENLRNETFYNLAAKCGLTLYSSSRLENDRLIPSGTWADSNDTTMTAENFIKKYEDENNWKLLSYISNYVGPDESGNPSDQMQIRYVHLRGATDEKEGAKFVIATKKAYSKDANGDDLYYFEPLKSGYVGSSGSEFTSDYIQKGQIVSAKGIFNEGKYPTAIRQEDDNVIFYRDNIESVSTGKINEVISGSIGKNQNIFQKAFSFFKTLFGNDDVDMNITVDTSKVQFTNETVTSTILTIKDGETKLSYFMPYNSSSNSYKITSLYIVDKIDLLLLIFAPIILIKMVAGEFFRLIQRSLDLFLIILTYPTAIVSLPLTENGYADWWEKFMARLFSTYGLILGINFVLMMFPVISGIQYFTQDEVGTSILIGRVSRLFFGRLTTRMLTNMLNMVTAILFELVAFTLLATIPELIYSIAGVNELDKADSVKKFMAVVHSAYHGFKKVIGGVINVLKMIPVLTGPLTGVGALKKGDKAVQNLKKKREFALKLVPGSAVFNEVRNKKALEKRQKDTKEKQKELANSMKNPIDSPTPPTPPGEDATDEEKQKYREEMQEYETRENMFKAQKQSVDNSFRSLLDAQANEAKDPNAMREEDQMKKWKDDLAGMKDTGIGDGETSKSSKKDLLDDSIGDDEIEEEMKYKSKRQLRKLKGKSKKRIENLEAWTSMSSGEYKNARDLRDAGKETKESKALIEKYEAAQKELARNKQIQEAAKTALKDRKTEEKEYDRDAAQKRMTELQNKFSSGEVPQAPKDPGDSATPHEKAEYQKQLELYNEYKELQDLDLILNRKKKRKEHNKEIEAKKKAENKEKKQKEKAKKNAQVLNENKGNVFTRAIKGAVADKIRNKREEDLIKRQKEIENQFTDLKDINKLIQEKHKDDKMSLGLDVYREEAINIIKEKIAQAKTPEEKKRLQEYLLNTMTLNNISDVKSDKVKQKADLKAKKEMSKADAQIRRNRELDNSRNIIKAPLKLIARKRNSAKAADLEEKEAELKNIQAQLADLQKKQGEKASLNVVSMDFEQKIADLQVKEAQLKNEIRVKNTWTKENNDTFRKQEKQGRKEQKKREKLEDRAIAYLEATGQEITEETISKTVDKYLNIGQVRKQNKQYKKMAKEEKKSMAYGDVKGGIHGIVNAAARARYATGSFIRTRHDKRKVGKFYEGEDFSEMSTERIESALRAIDKSDEYNEKEKKRLHNYAHDIISRRDNLQTREDAKEGKVDRYYAHRMSVYSDVGQDHNMFVRPFKSLPNAVKRYGYNLKYNTTVGSSRRKANKVDSNIGNLENESVEYLQNYLEDVKNNTSYTAKQRKNVEQYVRKVLEKKSGDQQRAINKEAMKQEDRQKFDNVKNGISNAINKVDTFLKGKKEDDNKK